jgi:cyclopropane fatty-acyl-phospholipid synthase-like methyltransferase
VQNPAHEVAFIDQVWKRHRGRLPTSLREDFAGTSILSMTWAKRRPGNTAIAVDIDPAVVGWGIDRHLGKLPEAARRRVEFVIGDVRSVKVPRVDCIAALNFSYYLFKRRAELVAYFRRCRAGLRQGGMLLLDAYGGSDSYLVQEEERDLDGFTYVWDTSRYNPITGDLVTHIHFRFPDRTELKKAFTYEWRLWSLPEIQECLEEAGFGEVHAYWEGTTRDGEGNGRFRPTRTGEACLGWIAYLVALR